MSPWFATHLQRIRRSLLTDAGAAAVEVAAIMVLVAVPLISIIGTLEDQQADQIESDAQRVGAPIEVSNGVPTPSAPIVVVVGSTGTPPGNNNATPTLSSATTVQNNKWWTTTVAIQLDDGTGTLIIDGLIDGTWTKFYRDGSTETVLAQCSLNSTGTCNLTLNKLERRATHNPVDQVTFEISALTSEAATLAPGTWATLALKP